jgi:hypothetical protein
MFAENILFDLGTLPFTPAVSDLFPAKLQTAVNNTEGVGLIW